MEYLFQQAPVVGGTLLVLLLLGPCAVVFGFLRGKDPEAPPAHPPTRILLAAVPFTGRSVARLTIALTVLGGAGAFLGGPPDTSGPRANAHLDKLIQDLRAAYPAQAEVQVGKLTPFPPAISTTLDQKRASDAKNMGLSLVRAELEGQATIEIYAAEEERPRLETELEGKTARLFACNLPNCHKYFTPAAMERLDLLQKNPSLFFDRIPKLGFVLFASALIFLFTSAGCGVVIYSKHAFQLKKREALGALLPTLSASSGVRVSLTPSRPMSGALWLRAWLGYDVLHRAVDARGGQLNLSYRPLGFGPDHFQGILVQALPGPAGWAFVPDSLLRELDLSRAGRPASFPPKKAG